MTDYNLLKKIEEIIAKTIAANNITNNKILLDEVDKKFIINNSVLLDAMDRKIKASEERLEERITKKLSKKIEDAQIDTIDSLTDIINEGYRLHEERILRIETKLSLPPLKQN